VNDEVDEALRLADAGDFEDGQWIVDALAAEVRRLQERDEAGAAVVRAVEENPIPRTVWTETPLGAALDELARVYEDKGEDRG
jgi:hypothetical protein